MKKTNLQVSSLFPEIDALQEKYDDPSYTAVYGAGCIKNPDVMFLFMNPTAKNLTAAKNWGGIRAPWIGLKNTWRFLYRVGVISKQTMELIESLHTSDWTPELTVRLYDEVAKNKVYLTNFARCTQSDARHVSDKVFRESREVTIKEIQLVNPKIVVSFGNQVGTHLLLQSIKVGEQRGKFHTLSIRKSMFDVCTTYYPVGMGQRNMSKSIEDIKKCFEYVSQGI